MPDDGSNIDGDPVFALALGLERTDLAPLIDLARKDARAAKAEATMRAYEGAWKKWIAWCQEHRLPWLPSTPQVVALFLSARAERGTSIRTLFKYMAAIAREHRLRGLPDPVDDPHVREIWRGTRNRHGRPPEKKLAITTDHLRAMVLPMPGSVCPLTRLRDRALLLVGFVGAFRRSELAAMQVGHLVPDDRGCLVNVPRSKTDQQGGGRNKHLSRGADPETCPVLALDAWMRAAGITTGPVFRPVDRWGRIADRALDPQTVARVVKRAAGAAGLPAQRMSGHSLRRGFLTTMADAGMGLPAMMRQSGHRDTKVAMGYIDEAALRREDYTRRAGL
jgi:integrase